MPTKIEKEQTLMLRKLLKSCEYKRNRFVIQNLKDLKSVNSTGVGNADFIRGVAFGLKHNASVYVSIIKAEINILEGYGISKN